MLVILDIRHKINNKGQPHLPRHTAVCPVEIHWHFGRNRPFDLFTRLVPGLNALPAIPNNEKINLLETETFSISRRRKGEVYCVGPFRKS
jgi:hypothetical protein